MDYHVGLSITTKADIDVVITFSGLILGWQASSALSISESAPNSSEENMPSRVTWDVLKMNRDYYWGLKQLVMKKLLKSVYLKRLCYAVLENYLALIYTCSCRALEYQ